MIGLDQHIAILRRLLSSEAEARIEHRTTALFTVEQMAASAALREVREQIADHLRHLEEIGALVEIQRVMEIADRAARKGGV